MNRHLPEMFHTFIILVSAATLLLAAINLHAIISNGHLPNAVAQSVHDLAVSAIAVSSNSVVRGELVYIHVTVENQGDETETFNVTVYAGTRPVSMPQTISSLPARASQNLTFTWNTVTAAEGYHAIKATASIVLGEIDTSDNTLLDGNVAVSFTAMVSSSNFYTATDLPFQRKSFHAAGLHWVFYSDYQDMVYRTSTNGIAWSAPTVVREALYGYLFSLWLDGTNVHYAYRDTLGILHRRGSISGATITWQPEHVVVTGKTWAPNICVDTNGIPWVSYRTNSIGVPADTRPYVVKAIAADGTAWDAPKQLSALDQLWWTVPVPLTSGKVYVLYSYPQGRIYGNLWNGNTWLTTPENVTSAGSVTRSFGSFASVAKGDNLYVVYLQNFTRDIVTLNRTNSGWGIETIIVPSDPDEIIFPEPPDPAPTITVDPSKGDLYVRWVRLKVYQIRYDATFKQWESVETPFGTFFNTPDPRSLTSYYQVWDSFAGSTWIEGTGTPYNVTYASEQV